MAWRQVWHELITQLLQPNAQAIELKIPAERNLIYDILREGQTKPSIHLLFEFDTQHARQYLAQLAAQDQKTSLTCLIGKAFATALQEQPEIQSALKGKTKRLIFKDIDLAFMVERELADQTVQPLHYIVRNAQSKTLAEIQAELHRAKTLPIGKGGPLSALETVFFRLPKLLRKLVWLWIRHDPYTQKQLLGTAGVTSMGMFAPATALVLPISPLSITLSIGGTSQRLILVDQQISEREFIQLNLTANHDITDGAPLMRFAARLKSLLEQNHC